MSLNLQERIENLNIYFDSMNVSAEEKIIYVRVIFPQGWVCSEVTEPNFNVKTAKDEIPGYFYFFADINIGFDKIFDAIDYNINFNLNAQEKVNLLREKIIELKNIFEEEEISVLKTLEFKYKKKKEKPKKNKNNINNMLDSEKKNNNFINNEGDSEC